MKATITARTRSARTASTITLALACASLASACSGEYPLGSASSSLDLAPAGAAPADEAAAALDASLPAVLPQHSFTIAVDDSAVPGMLSPVGDLDGDGYADTAQTNWDFATGASWVHIRYGGVRPRDKVEALAFDRDGAHLALQPSTYAEFYTVAGAGDVNGDGFDDLLLKSNECLVLEAGGTSGVYLVYGGPERFEGTTPLPSVSSHFAPPAYPDIDLNEPLNCGSSGRAFGAGDVDGDGIDDIAIVFGPQILADNSISYANGEGVQIFYGRSERFAAEVPLGAADAVFRAEGTSINAYAVGDVTADGRADLYIGPEYTIDYGKPGFLLEGSAQRWRGALETAALATVLPGVGIDSMDKMFGPRDIDGDGIDDLLLTDLDYNSHLFYGASGLFADGFDFADADALVPVTERSGYILSPGDLDGDGDDELLEQFYIAQELPRPMDVALLSGRRARFAGELAFPEDQVRAATPNGRFPDVPDRVLTYTIPAGDLDGDGADDLFTVSEYREVLSVDSYRTSAPQLHVHYGTKASVGDSPR